MCATAKIFSAIENVPVRVTIHGTSLTKIVKWLYIDCLIVKFVETMLTV